MRKKKWLRMMFGAFGLLIGGVSVVLAFSEAAVTNEFTAGIVDVEIRNSETGDEEMVLPGREIEKAYRIQNNGNDCYVRAELLFRGMEDITEETAAGMRDIWVRGVDGYYYCRNILRKGSSVDLIECLKIPESLSQDPDNVTFYLDVKVEAVQSQNFHPDFDAVSPWGEVEIIKNEKTESLRRSNSVGDTGFQIEYKGGSQSLFINEEDFFANFPILMPGDEYSDSAVILNDSDEEICLYFRSEMAGESPLADQLWLEILTEKYGKEKSVYRGRAGEKELEEGRLLITLPGKAKGRMIFRVSVPAGVGNEYSLMSSNIKWIFSTDLAADCGKEAVKTGDDQEVRAYFTGFTICFAAAILLAAGSQRMRTER